MILIIILHELYFENYMINIKKTYIQIYKFLIKNNIYIYWFAYFNKIKYIVKL